MPQKIKNITLYDVDEVAKVLNHHRNTILSKINKGDIRATKLKKGESWYTEHEELVRQCSLYNMPPDMIEYRLGIKSPKTGKEIKNAVQ